MQIELEVFSDFKAFHSLVGYETPHHHYFQVSASLILPTHQRRSTKEGAVIDLVEFQKLLNQVMGPLSGNDLNQVLGKPSTCENLCEWIFSRLQKLIRTPVVLSSVSVMNCNLERQPLGRATLKGLN
jgi:6-pyruvoyl-tetrahydropterin synthase